MNSLSVKIDFFRLMRDVSILGTLLLIYLVNEFLSSYLLVPVIIFLGAYFHTKRMFLAQLILGIYSFVLGNEIVTFFFTMVLFFFYLTGIAYGRNLPSSMRLVDLRLFVLLVLGLLSYLYTQFIESNPVSYPFWLFTFLPITAFYFYFSKYPTTQLERKEFVYILFLICLAQCVIIFFDFVIPSGIVTVLKHAVSPDDMTGTFFSTSEWTFFGMTVLILHFNLLRSAFGFWKRLLGFIILIFVFYSFARAYFGVFLLSYVFVLATFDFFIEHNKKLLSRSIVTVGFITIIVLFVKYFAVFYDSYLVLYAVGKYNAKSQFYERAIDPENRNTVQYLIGTGPGTIGSRSANSRASDTLHKKQKSSRAKVRELIPPFSSVWTKKYLADLYDEEYAEASGVRSALLGNPFNSTCAILFEFGIIGFLIYLSFFVGIIVKCLKCINYQFLNETDRSIIFVTIVLSVFIVAIGFLDTIFDRASVMTVFWLFLGLVSGIVQDINNEHLRKSAEVEAVA